jgi:hypothetical protein
MESVKVYKLYVDVSVSVLVTVQLPSNAGAKMH